MISYIRDDREFLNSIPKKKTQKKQTNDPDTLMVTFDVTDLFCNIPHELEKQIISFWIKKK